MIATLFTASCLWKGPNDSEEKIYFSGVSKKKFTNVSLVDSLDSSYATGTAFKLVGTNSDDLGRVYNLSTQLKSCSIKLFSDIDKRTQECNIILKISGIWENIREYGITFKFMDLHS